MLDLVRTSWEGFFQEMGGVIGKISNARSASALMMEKAWFAAACGEWDAIVTGTENIIGTTTPKKTMACVYCDVPVVLSVPVRAAIGAGRREGRGLFLRLKRTALTQHLGIDLGNPYVLDRGLC